MASAPSTLLTGKTAIVTGGARGIGRGISLELAKRGASVAMIYMSSSTGPKAQGFAKELQSLGSGARAVAIQADLSESEAPGKVVEQTLALLKVDQIDIIVNNAALGDWTATSDITMPIYERVMNTNVRAPLFLVQAALPYIPQGGRIINISSYAARAMLKGDGIPPMGLYIASKIALEGLSQGWAAEFGHSRGITANSVSVGMVETDLIASMPEEQKDLLKIANAKVTAAAPRTGTPDDIAQVVSFLASESSRWVTGSTVSANGGIIVI